MIKDCIKKAKLYYNLSPQIKKAFEWLNNQDIKNIKAGRYYIEDKTIYANVDEYYTKEDANYEAHRKYIDIQYMINGEELIGVTNIDNCKTCIEYDEEKDIEFFTAQNDYISLRNEEFLILFPHDAHKPCITKDKKTYCKKIVVKVATN